MVGRGRTRGALRVVAWPAFINRHQNPYTSLLYGAMARLGVRVEDFLPWKLLLGRPDVWHIHWPESILNLRRRWLARPLAFLLRVLLRVARAHGVKIIWTVHNLQSHEGRYPALECRLWQTLVNQLDGFIALSEGGKRLVLRRYPPLRRRPGFVIPHGDYRAAYPNTITRAEARSRLDLPERARVVVSFGQVRPYKNLPHLIRTFGALAAPDTYLVVAGNPSGPDVAAEIRATAGDDPQIRLHLDFVAGEDVQIFLRAADLAVLPYREVLNSGSAILALSFACPILVPARGAMAELQRDMGWEWVRTYGGELRPETLREALGWALQARRDPARLLHESPHRSWEAIARQTVAAYAAIGAPPRPAPAGEPARPPLLPRRAGHP